MTLNNTSPTPNKDDISAIFVILFGILFTFALLITLFKRRTRTSKIHSCTPLTSNYKYNKPKKIDTGKPTINRARTGRPRDYIVEQLKPLKKSTPTTQRKIPRAPSKEVSDENVS